MDGKKASVIYVAAASHSGSTLAALLLGSHPSLCTVGELNASQICASHDYLCSCRKKAVECEFWSSISERMVEKGFDYEVTRGQTDYSKVGSQYIRRLQRPLVRGAFLEFVRGSLLNLSPRWRGLRANLDRRNEALIRSIIEETGAQAIVDSSKIGCRLKYLLENPRIDVKVIWLTRDARGVALAYNRPAEFADAKDPKLRGGGTGESSERSRDLAQAAREWVRCNEETLALVRRMKSDRWIHIRYEDLCSNAEAQLQRLFSFIGLKSINRIEDFRQANPHVVGNGMRLDSSSEIVLDDRWREEVTKQEHSQILEVAGRMQERLGYESH